MVYQYDLDFYARAKDILATIAALPAPEVHDVEARRKGVDAFFGAPARATPHLPDVEHTKFEFPSYDGVEISIHRFAKKGAQSIPGPAVLEIHGGGMIAGDVETFRPGTEQRVAASGVPVFSIEYRLAPEHPFPVPIEDCYAGLLWLHEHAVELNVDPKRIGLYGSSAGGGLCAGVSLVAQDRKLSPPLAKQILIYPMIDARNVKPVDPELGSKLFWTLGSNITGWTAYLGGEKGFDNVSPYASPSLAESVEGSPPTYIDTGGLDLFRDEDIEFAARLARTDVPVEFHLYPGVPHAFESLAPGSRLQLLSFANRIRAMQSF